MITREMHVARNAEDSVAADLVTEQEKLRKVSTQLDAIMQSAAVSRHHANMTNATQSVGEHTYGVLWILFIIAPQIDLKLFMAALAHDTPEYVTGDIPAPAKRSGLVDKAALEETEARIMISAGLLDCNPLLTDFETKLLKLADNLEGAAWYASEVIRGNGHATKPLNTYCAWLQDTVHINETAALMLTSIKEKVYEYRPEYKFQ